MENLDVTHLVGWFGVLPAVLLVGLSKILPMLTGARSDIAESGARVGMLDQLQARLARVEDQQKATQNDLDAERTARRAAEDKVSKLYRRVTDLEAQIRGLGGTPLPNVLMD
jgi:hypothetical protein